MAEILHQLIGSFSHYLQGFIHPRWCKISAINSSTTFEKQSQLVPKKFVRYLKWRVSYWNLSSPAVLGMGIPVSINRTNTAYIGEDYCILGSWNVWWISGENPLPQLKGYQEKRQYNTHKIHLWYIYLHLVDYDDGKCRKTYIILGMVIYC